jgi:uncharacterized membrane protein
MGLLKRGLGSTLVSQWDTLRGSYWFVPMLMAALGSGLALGLLELDARLSAAQIRSLPWIHADGPEGTRALLSTVAGSMITVTGVVFSITIVALALASSQFGPRLLRNFLRDLGNQMVLGTFVATFLYSLLVLRAVAIDRVPHVSAAIALALAVTSVFVLIYFIHHVASSIQASSIIASVAMEIDQALSNVFPEELGQRRSRDEAGPRLPAPSEEDGALVLAPSSGYVRVVDGDELFELAVDRDLVIELVVKPGEFIAEGDRLARVAPASRVDEGMLQGVCESIVIGTHRTAVQDLAFLTDQLVEMAVRALSPGTNDPKTAVACVQRLGVVISRISRREMPSSERCDETGALRMVARGATFAGVVASCLDPIRRYAGDDAEVIESALLALASALEQCPDSDRREVLMEHAREWHGAFGGEPAKSKRDRARVDDALARVEDAVIERGGDS